MTAVVPFDSLRAFLTGISLLPVEEQANFALRANLLGNGQADEQVLKLRDSAVDLMRRVFPGESVSDRTDLLWTQWSGPSERHGLGLLLESPRGPLLLLPKRVEPNGLTFQPQLPGEFIFLGAAALFPPEPDPTSAPSPLPMDRYLGAVDPRTRLTPIRIDERRPLRNAAGEEIGWARAVSGGAKGFFEDPESWLSLATSVGDGLNQEDGVYAARFRTKDGRDVRVLVGVDGLGGAAFGEFAAGAAIRGAHAAVAEAAADGKLLFAGDVFDIAREILLGQIALHERKFGSRFDGYQSPDAVIAVIVMIDDEATIATAGDFLVAYCERREDGSVRTRDLSDLDVSDDYSVKSTLGNGRKRLYHRRMRSGSWMTAGSDGLLGSILPRFKDRCAKELREMYGMPDPEESMLHNLDHILRHTHPLYVARALHNVSMGYHTVPGPPPQSSQDKPRNYPGLGVIAQELDNKSAVAAYWPGANGPKRPPLDIPLGYLLLETVMPAYQYVYGFHPRRLNLPRGFMEMYIGGEFHPEDRPAIVLDDIGLADVHARLFREGANADRIFIEKLVEQGEIQIEDKNDQEIALLTEKGSRQEIQAGHWIRLSENSFFRFEGE